MPIEIVWGTGTGDTELGAFDNALSGANIHNYNLIELSSVVPTGAGIERAGTLEPGRWTTGDLLAVVLASATSSADGETIAAGLGWATAPEGGIFMEHHDAGREPCARQLAAKVADAKRTRDWEWTEGVETEIVEHVVDGVGAAVVAAVFHPLSDGLHDDDR